jgi:hypothetical protein
VGIDNRKVISVFSEFLIRFCGIKRKGVWGNGFFEQGVWRKNQDKRGRNYLWYFCTALLRPPVLIRMGLIFILNWKMGAGAIQDESTTQ